MVFRLTIEAFCCGAETAEALRNACTDRQLAKSRLGLMEGGLAAAITHYADLPTPQVLVVEESDPTQLRSRLDQLAEVCVSGTKVVVIGPVNDIRLYRELMAKGVADYLPAPAGARQLVDSLAGLFADPASAPRARVVACWGARGGTGSSTLAQNLAWAAARHLAEKVILIDLDIAFGTSVLAFNLEAKQSIADVLANPERLDEVLVDRCMAEYDDHLQILAAPGDGRGHGVTTLEPLEHLVDLASRMAALVVLDIPHVWAEWSEALLAGADEVVVTAIADFASLRDTKTLVDLLSPRRQGMAPLRLVLNRAETGRKAQLSAKDFAETLKMTPDLVIPSDPALFGEAATEARMLGEVAANHKIVQSLGQLAVTLSGKAPVVARKPAKSRSLLDWLRR
ncbi:Type II/IV secretion system ATPase TadZ/CpaE associated with Flp pilus assembly [Paramagnetospirillum magnetotacticum MS-1]|uniref:Type II/IV secretion system ATPase TadZ/CpaE associated with Flp pilus assembly n=1 Tax=Paramagnetospirillum magnetotacticum MS-1 TaxID=272627 RepID=A0A0C2YX72_PARME|nr:cellulose synthase operon protein YhjQ/BcsQ [Paramagnetospirillum magnetotacticum]KIL99708.1 Type II/IV secretion system ATPase TadZ/CpaE associated with Flp pilus assembly [Paramagnetospirillum magnetotacticum MS-1]